MNKGRNIMLVMTFLATTIYLFVTAPPPLNTEPAMSSKIPINYVLEALNEENKIARKLYTQEIVQAGKKVGLKFDEDWIDRDIVAGPLPAQFLRLTANNLEKSEIQLGLYLGSDFPINNVNLFSGKQASLFESIKKTLVPQFFFVEDIDRYTYMAADVAVSKACVDCHNKHKDTPKKDWKSGDVMGATTWTYPKKFVSYKQFMIMLMELRLGLNKAYEQYLDKVKTFPSAPKIGKRWPRNGYYLPDVETFSTEIVNRTSTHTLTLLLTLVQNDRRDRRARDD